MNTKETLVSKSERGGVFLVNECISNKSNRVLQIGRRKAMFYTNRESNHSSIPLLPPLSHTSTFSPSSPTIFQYLLSDPP